jgi:hypothetical protein
VNGIHRPTEQPGLLAGYDHLDISLSDQSGVVQDLLRGVVLLRVVQECLGKSVRGYQSPGAGGGSAQEIGGASRALPKKRLKLRVLLQVSEVGWR